VPHGAVGDGLEAATTFWPPACANRCACSRSVTLDPSRWRPAEGLGLNARLTALDPAQCLRPGDDGGAHRAGSGWSAWGGRGRHAADLARTTFFVSFSPSPACTGGVRGRGRPRACASTLDEAPTPRAFLLGSIFDLTRPCLPPWLLASGERRPAFRCFTSRGRLPGRRRACGARPPRWLLPDGAGRNAVGAGGPGDPAHVRNDFRLGLPWATSEAPARSIAVRPTSARWPRPTPHRRARAGSRRRFALTCWRTSAHPAAQVLGGSDAAAGSSGGQPAADACRSAIPPHYVLVSAREFVSLRLPRLPRPCRLRGWGTCANAQSTTGSLRSGRAQRRLLAIPARFPGRVRFFLNRVQSIRQCARSSARESLPPAGRPGRINLLRSG